MTLEEARNLKVFNHFCTCGGYAWSINGRDPARPHMEWCPQAKQYNQWYDLVGKDMYNGQSTQPR